VEKFSGDEYVCGSSQKSPYASFGSDTVMQNKRSKPGITMHNKLNGKEGLQDFPE
jgi:hypothetical protein